MNTLREKLLQLMAGTSAQKWMDRRELLAKSGAAEPELDAALEGLHADRAINRTRIIRGDREIHAIWITGVVAKIPYSQFTINPKILPPSGTFTRSDPVVMKEKPMKSHEIEQKKSVMQRVLDIIILEPGVTQESIKRRFTKGEQSACNKAFYGLRQRGRIDRKEENGVTRYHPTAIAADHVGHARRAKADTSPAKLITGDEARPFQQGEAVTRKEKPTANDDAGTVNDTTTIPSFLLKKPDQHPHETALANVNRFRCAWTSDGTLMLLGINVLPIELTPEQTQTIVKFVREERC